MEPFTPFLINRFYGAKLQVPDPWKTNYFVSPCQFVVMNCS